MRRNLGVAILGVLLGGAGAAALVHQPSAQGQPAVPRPGIEYRVELVDVGHHGSSAGRMTEALNARAAEGWEYVGPVADSSMDGPTYIRRPGVFLLFRRPK
ncbi:hypothetical protein OJF2_08980 [Aquisphaera giovannonii]|uniref:DUF4177 domain-containing protein n=2 Tax=Aquisphaera giovannonii TaxID=406548 RepID=A0A5B9VWU9_9BACT|nr:hypothetical protein OJF2_08980 [Aquisphaera giovannonii]